MNRRIMDSLEDRRRAREQLRYEREALRLGQMRQRIEQQRRITSLQDEALRLTTEVTAKIAELRGLLAQRQVISPGSVFGSLGIKQPPPVLTIPKELEQPAAQPVIEAYAKWVRPLAWWERFFAYRTRYQREMSAAQQRFSQDYAAWQASEQARTGRIGELQHRHEAALGKYWQAVEEQHQKIEDLRRRFTASEVDAVITYFDILVGSSPHPEDFPKQFRIAYDPSPKLLAIDYQLPTKEVVPSISEYRYVKTRDAIDEKPRKANEVNEVYRETVAAIALRCISECFTADKESHVEVLAFSGYVHTTDPATGNPIQPYLISVRVTKERFAELNLDRIDTKACLRNLGAQVSPQPAELIAVKPIIEFDMVDKRFIEERNVLAQLDSRPNLMDLTPAEFEALVANLFTKMGLETKLTRTNRDGGVDAVAFDIRPILGGKVVIQAKRYSHTVGVSAVRDLYGTMMNEGANKGILVTTSSYGPDAYDFCKDKPVELIDGSGLLYHLQQIGYEARIVFPDDQAAAM